MESPHPGVVAAPAAPAAQPELIETLRRDADGAMPLLARHLQRLQAACAALGYPCDLVATRNAIAMAAREAGDGPQRLRVLTDAAGRPRVQAAPLPPLAPPQTIRWAARILDSSEPLLRLKTTYRPWYEQAAQWLAAHPEVFDLVFCNERGEICEGSRSNVYLQLDGVWYTPPVTSGCLPGVQRAALLDQGMARERVLTRNDLSMAQALRLSNALRGWFDVLLDPAHPAV